MSRKFSLAALAFATTALVPLAAQAQEVPAAAPAPAEAGGDTVDEIIVSARRRDERLVDTPVAITAVTGAKLEAMGVTEFTDLATLVPTMVAGRAASGSSASIFLRGVGSTALSAGFDQSVSFNVDGLPMSRGREISLSQYDVQRIEVLKGPQALFYGKNATGGLVSVVTRSPTDVFEAGFKTGYGVEASEIYGEGYISGPLSDQWRARLAVRLSDSEGAFDNTAEKTYPQPFGLERRRTDDKRGGGTTASGRLTLEYNPTDNFEIQLKAGATLQKDGGPTDVLERICGGGRTTPATANGIPPSPNADCRIDGRSDGSDLPREVAETMRYAGDGSIYADLSSQFAILTATAEFDLFDLTSITSYYRFKQTDLNNVAGEGYPASFSQLAKYSQLAEEIRLSTKFDGPVNVMVGFFGSTNDFTFNTDAYIFPVPLDPINDTYVTFRRDDGFTGSTQSVFFDLTWDIADQWELSGGARWSREERDSYQRSLPGHIAFAAAFPGNMRLADEFSDENVSPQATLRYKPTPDSSIYVSYKEGFKTGGFNISQSLTPAASVAAGEFGSETAKGWEVGYRAILLDGALTFNATIYDFLYEDLQVQNFDPVTIGQVVANAGELRTRGVETDFDWTPVQGLSIRGALAYNKAEYDNYVGQCYGGQTIADGCNLLLNGAAFTSQDYSGRTPPKAPEWGARLGATYETPIGDWSLQLNGDLSYTSEYNFTDTLRPDAVQDAYTKVDASVVLFAPGDRWKVSLIGRNLTEEYVVTSANDIPFTGGTGTGTAVGVLSDMSAFVENPREITLEFSMKF
ncbi:MAG: TonB-dependent receptor [Caulobacter sp.]|jgi:outer membrane receptor protein involved in Fe transport|nr:TonB-dependent receptor [Caulobacter sp.]